MNKSIVALAAAVAVGVFAQASAAQTGGIRIGHTIGPSQVTTPAAAPVNQQLVPVAPSQENPSAQRAREAAEKREAAAAAARQRVEQAAAARDAKRQAAAKGRPNLAALPMPATSPAPAQQTDSDRELLAAQEAQRAKAEELLRQLTRQDDERAPAPQPPRRTETATPGMPSAPAGECRRFIAGANTTVKVPCSE